MTHGSLGSLAKTPERLRPFGLSSTLAILGSVEEVLVDPALELVEIHGMDAALETVVFGLRHPKKTFTVTVL